MFRFECWILYVNYLDNFRYILLKGILESIKNFYFLYIEKMVYKGDRVRL